MRVSASLGLVILLLSLATCDQRNFDRCLQNNADYACEAGKFCKPIEGDPDGVGLCVASECTATAPGIPNGCTSASTPVCNSLGRCVSCTTNTQCAAISSTQPVCIVETGSCAQCSIDKDCASDPSSLTPACDKTAHTCRACGLHSECASKVCAKDDTLKDLPNGKGISLGMCAPVSRVLIADDTAALGPVAAKASADTPYVLVKSYTGANGTTVPIGPIPGLPEQHLISATADYSVPAAASNKLTPVGFKFLTVNAGASVTIEGFVLSNSTTTAAVTCNSGGTTATTVRLLRTTIASSDLAVRTNPLCHLVLDQSWIGTPPGSTANGNYEALRLDSTQFEIVNTVFNHNFNAGTFGGITLTDSKAGNLQGSIVNSTFYRQESADAIPAMAVYCQAAPKALTIFNTLFVNSTGFTKGKPYVDPSCYKAPNVLGFYATDEVPASMGTSLISGITDSIFVSASTAMLSLMPSEPSAKSLITGGTKSFNNIASPPVDIQGKARGAASVSIGAFEVAH